ncbi:ImmA/IrrE family metallo-endopeptidase [Pyxidicoccus parkwayensis]|uniref:ImmA/IrrE family metallo-endopeptidase n=1 Tax=Pyxidicoccus parkwayensis TaxID=2813578 RepID=A0ABX7P3V9_9BACT|nr:ImmA/IrrE family metallo-endopeptidase [Pyxidicoccus parkwaysis]QSQ25163.1 ImmA/IrrE family metallo-endopeptidase [Pyxidicoccus parkwaysis]
MTAPWLEEAVSVFGSREPPSFPRKIAEDILLRLRITIVPQPHPTPDSMSQWLVQRKYPCQASAFPETVHGCMVWIGKVGILFHDSAEDPAEQRFTLAHEASHFVLDHLLPRRRAMEVFGQSILEVLDGKRGPTPEESMTALFERVSLKPSNLIRRSESGHYTHGAVVESERRADQLALELLAPAALARPLLEGASETAAAERVLLRFGLPVHVARAYVASLRRRLRKPRFSSQDFFGFDGG